MWIFRHACSSHYEGEISYLYYQSYLNSLFMTLWWVGPMFLFCVDGCPNIWASSGGCARCVRSLSLHVCSSSRCTAWGGCAQLPSPISSDGWRLHSRSSLLSILCTSCHAYSASTESEVVRILMARCCWIVPLSNFHQFVTWLLCQCLLLFYFGPVYSVFFSI